MPDNSTIFEQHDHWQKLKDGIVSLAKQEVLRRFEHVTATRKADGSVLTEADTQMQIKTAEFLASNWPQFEFLGEESSPEEQDCSLHSDCGCWVLDPVDGTNNFAHGVPFFSVSLALVVKGEIVLGLIYDPSRDELFSARKGLGAELNDQPLIAQSDHTILKRTIAIIDFKRLDSKLACNLVTEAPYSSQRSFGSVALDWCWIAAGRSQIYLHGSQHLWDYAAGWLILDEAGGVSSTLDGEPVYIQAVVKRSAIAATTPELFSLWQEKLNQLR
jgi:myo-inositol-1(or 4)-monophosphatase